MRRYACIIGFRHTGDLHRLEHAAAIGDVGHDNRNGAGIEDVAKPAAAINPLTKRDRDTGPCRDPRQASKVEGIERFLNPADIKIAADIEKAHQLVVAETAGQVEHQLNIRPDFGAQGFDALDRLTESAVRPTQGRTLAVMQVSGGSQSFNAVNQMRVLGRWMRMVTIPNQSSVAKAFQEFDEAGRMKPSSYYDRVVDVMEELVKFTLLTRDVSSYLTDRYSERKESGEALMRRVNLSAAT